MDKKYRKNSLHRKVGDPRKYAKNKSTFVLLSRIRLDHPNFTPRRVGLKGGRESLKIPTT